MYGMLWARDKEKEPIETTIENAYIYYKEKYKEEPTIIECSNKDVQEAFLFKKIKVTPVSTLTVGTLWLTGDSFKNKERIVKEYATTGEWRF